MRRTKMPLTEDQKVRYVTEDDGLRCPFCQKGGVKSDYEKGYYNLTGGLYLEIPNECPTCGEEWMDIFKLHDIEDVSEPSGS